jgi:hypothetical protein
MFDGRRGLPVNTRAVVHRTEGQVEALSFREVNPAASVFAQQDRRIDGKRALRRNPRCQ